MLGAACSNTTNTNEQEASNENENVSVVTNTSTNTNSDDQNENRNTNTSSDDSTGDHEVSSSGALRVSSPERNKNLESPFEVEGTSSASLVYVRVKNAVGTELFTESAKVRGGEFHINITYTFTHTTVGVVEIFEKDSAGAEVNNVSIPVTFRIESEDSTSLTGETTSNENENHNANTDDMVNEDTNE